MLLVRRRNGNVPRRRGDEARSRRIGTRGTRAGAPPRNGLPGGVARPGDRRAAPRPPVRGTCLRRLRAPMKAKLSTDGGARGNPGPAAYGYVLEALDGTVLDARGEAIGVATNNVAEYRALVAGLQAALSRGVTELEVVSDSELLVKQMRGEYRVKNAALRELSLEAARRTPAANRRAPPALRRTGISEARRLILSSAKPSRRYGCTNIELPLRLVFRDRKISNRMT